MMILAQIIRQTNKYGSVQELRSTFREFDFVLVMFHFGSECKGMAWFNFVW